MQFLFDKAKISDEHQCAKTFIHLCIHRFTCLTCFTAAAANTISAVAARQPLQYNLLGYTATHRIFHSATLIESPRTEWAPKKQQKQPNEIHCIKQITK